MHSSSPSGEPRILRCPHCGAPLDSQPFAVMARCAYCGHNVKLAEPSLPRPPDPTALPVRRKSNLGPALSMAFATVGLVAIAAVFVFIGARSSTAPTVAPRSPAAGATLEARARPPVPAASVSAKAPEVRYPLSSLLGISSAIDIDGSKAHLQGLFPTVGSNRVADQLRYAIPLSHPWFGVAELSWKNERAGKLATVAFRPPRGDQKLKNPKEIADCLSKGLGKPEVREIDHLAGDVSYFWGRHFPKAWANVYSGYLWLSFLEPKGIPPVTFTQVVRTLDGCAPSSP
jgi:hypothetical protein